MKLKFKYILTFLISMLSVMPMTAQTDGAATQENPVILYSGTPKRYEIADITITGIEENNHKTLLRLSGLAVGQRVTVPGADITQAMKRLWETGLFANVKIKALRISGDRIWLGIEIEKNPKIREVVFHGVRKGEASDLEEKIGMFPGSQIQGSYIDTRGGRVPLEILLKETRNRDLKLITSGVDGEFYPLVLEVKGKEARRVMDVVKKVVRNDDRFDVSFAGTYFTNREMIKELCGVLIISILLLFFILAAQFESLVQPFIILSELIIDIFAVLGILWLFGESLNLMSMIGMVVMCGIVINDSILKVDTINRLREQGMGLKHAILEAGGRRLKAIIMTSLTTILAIAPFLVRGDMGSDLQYPLSLALISGMIAGTFVSVFFVPLAYYVIYKRTDQ